jgi:hypothetical protein
MLMLQEMKLQLQLGKRLEFLQREFHFYLRNIIGGVLVLFDLVDPILKYFIGYEAQNFHQKVLM